MNHRIVSALLVLATAFVCPAAQFKIGPHTFTLPDGFEIERIAGTDLVPRPIEADFDEQGRLYVTDSSGSNDKVQKQLEDKPHRIVRLEDTDGDGRFDKSIVFADKMSFLEGAMWLDGSLYVSAPPSIWKLTDTNNDGVADVRVEWFQGKTLTGCANDLHGPYAGPDGWIYWCKGAFAKQTYTLPTGKEFNTRASHIFRARPDGTGIEPVMTGGMDNPVGLAFTPEGDRILSCTFFQHPEAGRRDGLIHAIYGGVYGKVHDVIDDHVKTGELMPVLTHLGPAAPCGMIRYESASFGKEFRDNLFVCSFNLHKLVRSVLHRDGATYKTTDTDFLVSDNTDFHPTDVLEDADGSLIVVDTGGWYKLCCPTSQLYKPDVLGAIYRVRRTGAARIADPRGLKINFRDATTAKLVDMVGDSRPQVVTRATRELVARKKEATTAVEAVLQTPASARSEDARRNAVWALTQIDLPEARQAIRSVLNTTAPAGVAGNDSALRVALHAVSLWRDKEAAPSLLRLAASNPALPPDVVRDVAEALGRIGTTDIAGLLKAVPTGTTPDRVLEHSIAYALIELNEPAATRQALHSSNPAVQRVAFIALDQMQKNTLTAADVLPLLKSENARLKETASWIISHHADWGDALAGFFSAEFSMPQASARRAELQQQLVPLTSNPAIQDAVGVLLNKKTLSKDSRIALLEAMGRSGLKELPVAWRAPLLQALGSPDEEITRQAVLAARALPPKKGTNDLRPALLALGNDKNRAEETRIAALDAAGELPPASFPFVLESLAPTKPLAVRGTAASLLARSRLNAEELTALLPALKTAGPLELSRLLTAFGRSKDEAVGEKLVKVLKDAAAFSSLRPENVVMVLSNFPPAVRAEGAPLVQALNADAAQAKQHVDQLLAALKPGDVRRGQALFNSEKTACASCHAIGYLGGKVGPDLTRIGQIRNERDLLEAIIYPSASFVRSFEPMIVATKGGDEYSGVLRKDAPDEVILVTGPNAEQRIVRSDIADMRPGAVSVMPAGLAEQLTKDELADLLAFLKATKW